MTAVQVRVIDVFPYRLTGVGVQFLLLRRSPDRVYAGEWRVVGGKMGPDEAAWEAALRELREETGAVPARFWTVPSINAFYEWQHDRVNLIPAFAAELSADPVLCAEHDAFAWLGPDEAGERLVWPEPRRLLKMIAHLVETGIPPELVVPVSA